MVVVDGLLFVPHIEGLVQQQHTQPVADLHQRQRRGIVGHPQCVEAGLLQQPDLPLLGRREGSCAQNAVVVVDAAAPELHGLAVEPEAVDGVGGNGADAEGSLRRVGDRAVGGDGGPQPVQVGIFRAPQGRVFHGQGDGQRRFLTGPDRHGVGDGGGAFDFRADLGLPGPVRGDQVADFHHGLMLIRLHRLDEHVPRLHPDVAAGPQEHVPVQARAGIPAGGGLHIVGDDFQLVAAVEPGVFGQVHQKRRVAVGMLGNLIAVPDDLGIAVGAVHVQNQMCRLFGPQVADVVGAAAHKEAVGGAAGGLGVPGPGNGVVIGQVQLFPVLLAVKKPVPAVGNALLLHDVTSQ